MIQGEQIVGRLRGGSVSFRVTRDVYVVVMDRRLLVLVVVFFVCVLLHCLRSD